MFKYMLKAIISAISACLFVSSNYIYPTYFRLDKKYIKFNL